MEPDKADQMHRELAERAAQLFQGRGGAAELAKEIAKRSQDIARQKVEAARARGRIAA